MTHCAAKTTALSAAYRRVFRMAQRLAEEAVADCDHSHRRPDGNYYGCDEHCRLARQALAFFRDLGVSRARKERP